MAATAPLEGRGGLAAAASALLGKALLAPMARGGRRGLSTLIYHRVLAARDELMPFELERVAFERQIAWLASCCRVLPLDEAAARLRAGTLPARAACITFDDGYADNAELALPILQKYGVPATFFAAAGFLDGGCMWNDAIIDLVRRTRLAALDARVLGLGCYPLDSLAARNQAIDALIAHHKYLPMAERQASVDALAQLAGVAPRRDLMMTSAQVRQLHDAGMRIGAHTMHHPILARLPAAQARAEIADGKRRLEDIIDAPVTLFAYPNGKPGRDYLPEHVAMVKALGFQAAVSTAWGGAGRAPDLFQLPRFTPWDRGPARFMLRLARNLGFEARRVSDTVATPSAGAA